MDTLLYLVARAVIGFIQSLPLPLVARLGRAGGWAACLLDARHRRMAFRNLKRFLGADKSDAEVRAIVRENFRRIGENFACAVRTAAMTDAEICGILEVTRLEKILPSPDLKVPISGVFAIGHFGNFELYARLGPYLPGTHFATTYRGLRQPALNRLLQDLRARSGCVFFERRSEAKALMEAMNRCSLCLGLLADQHAGDRGLCLPFFGEDCSTSAAPAVFALRYHRPLHTAVCYRVALARWRIEIGDAIPTHENGQPRLVEAIMLDVNKAFETAVRRDPANWFWVHNRWKTNKYRKQNKAGTPAKTDSMDAAPPK